MSQRVGPYHKEAVLDAAVRMYAMQGESVMVERCYMPHARKGKQFEGYIIRGASV